MVPSYCATAPDRTGFVSAPSPEAVAEVLRREAFWSPGRCEITTTGLLFDSPRRHWGVVTKHPDGSVELVPDGPA